MNSGTGMKQQAGVAVGCRSKRRFAFTLVELLVVIAIIVVLAAILFPVFSRAIHAAKGRACSNNLSQIGKAVFLYASNYDDRVPEPFWDQIPENYHSNTLLAHGVNIETFRSPFDTYYYDFSQSEPLRTDTSYFDQFGTSYHPRFSLSAVKQLSGIDKPSERCLFDDFHHFRSGANDYPARLSLLMYDGSVKIVEWFSRTDYFPPD